ncbi:MAG: hypothetical protein MCSN_1570 [Candidatus Microsyncoccus archaeolyticus]|jgi:hypothetical protein|nr:MAG: hypothetical protein MCSN_1570 [Candidatus Parcubacteria bacterium]
MEYKKAISILLKMINDYSFKKEEKEAILTAIGTLDCGSLAENRLKKIIKSKKDKNSRC